MKLKTIPVLLFAITLYACNNGTKTTVESNAELTSHGQENHKADHHQQPTSLSLNNGLKWNADQSTSLHAEKLVSKAKSFNNKKNPDMAAYQSFASGMQMDLNSLIKDCKMSGPDHDALHQWLEPVLRNVNDLTKATADHDAKELAKQLTGNVLKYKQYFN